MQRFQSGKYKDMLLCHSFIYFLSMYSILDMFITYVFIALYFRHDLVMSRVYVAEHVALFSV